jgi:hypothetical protein
MRSPFGETPTYINSRSSLTKTTMKGNMSFDIVKSAVCSKALVVMIKSHSNVLMRDLYPGYKSLLNCRQCLESERL